jgi:hypothetical protein
MRNNWKNFIRVRIHVQRVNKEKEISNWRRYICKGWMDQKEDQVQGINYDINEFNNYNNWCNL